MAGGETILWRRLDRPGHEAARLSRKGEDWSLAGTAVFLHEGEPCRVDYAILCDSDWRTSEAVVEGWVGREAVQIEIAATPSGRWRMNGVERPEVEGSLDLDLNFSPSTNLLPIRRLDLAVGGEARVRAAWLRFPSFGLEPLEQSYRRVAESTYRYESAGGRFVAELEVNAAGFVTLYPEFCRVEAAGR
jgi:uncharacterized protein